MVKLVAFDWNGTLFSDTQTSLNAVNLILRHLKLPEIDRATYQSNYDIPISKFFVKVGVTEEIYEKNWEAHLEIFNTYYESILPRIRTRSNTKMVLKWLKENNIESIILSNHRVEPIKKELKRLGIRDYFLSIEANIVFAISLKERNKKDRFKDFLKKNNYKGEETLIVGDTVEEIEIGKDLGATTVAITQGSSSLKRLKKAKPDYIIHNLKELVPIITKLNSLVYK